jgi:hypothetical protein
MITIISQPDKWTSVYEPCLYEFRDITNLGTFDITDNYTFNKAVISAGTGIINFYVGQVVGFTISAVYYVANVTAISGSEAILDLPIFLATYPSIDIQEYNNSPLQVSLNVGKIASGYPMELLSNIYAVPSLGLYSLDVSGYLQDYFSNIAKPPVTGIDKELYCNYQLNELTMKYGLYSTQEDINSLPVSSVLRVGDVETFSGQGSVYTRLMSNFVQNFTI